MRTLLEIGLSNALIASGLAVIAALASRLGARPALRHALWLLVLLKLVVPPLRQVPVELPRPNLAIVAEEPAPAPASGRSAVGIENPGFVSSASDVYVVETNFPTEPVETVEPDLERGSIAPPEPLWRATLKALDLPLLLGAFWLCGSLGWISLAAVRLARFGLLLRHAEPADDELQTEVEALSGLLGLRRAPRIERMPGAISPMVWGLIGAPRLIIPEALWKRLDADERETLLIHELAHLRRRDHWVRVLELVATGLYWWHPALWCARRALRDAEEQCCDAWVVWAAPGSAKSYANALLTAVDFLSETRRPLPLLASGVGHVEHLKRRLTMILRGMTPKGLSWAGRMVMLGLAGGLLPFAPTGAREPDRDDAKAVAGFELLTEDVIGGPFAVFLDDDKDDDDDDDEEKDREKRKEKEKRIEIELRGQAKKDAKSEEKREVKEEKREAKEDDEKVKAALEQARAELRDAEKHLADAARKVAELEGKRHAQFNFTTPDGRVRVFARDVRSGAEGGRMIVQGRQLPGPGGEPVVVEGGGPGGRREVRVFRFGEGDGPTPPLAPTSPMPPRGPRGNAGPDAQRRIDELERKLDRVLEELKSMKRDRDAK